MSHVIRDFDEVEILIGTVVRLWDYSPTHPEWPHHEKFVGLVTSLGDFDGDTDSYGRPVPIYPEVTVRFRNGDEQSFSTCDWKLDWRTEHAEGHCEELTALTTKKGERIK